MAKIDGNSLVVKALKDEGVDTVFYLTGGPMVDPLRPAVSRDRVPLPLTVVTNRPPRRWPHMLTAASVASRAYASPPPDPAPPT